MTAFYKLSGGGNDFLALAEPDAPPPPEQIRAWCRRGVSLGADGLFLLRRAADGAVMEYFNADGHPADLCLNGTRCAAQLAFHLGWAADTAAVHTGAGTIAARRLDAGRVSLELPAPEPPQPLTVEIGGIPRAGYRVRVGVPHFVLLWDDLEGAPVRELGAAIRRHPCFAPEGTNVNFVRFVPQGARQRMEIRTFERGVEDETLACGTGVLAGAAVGLALQRAELPLRVLTRGGFELAVSAAPGGSSGRWQLAGDARIVAAGDLLPAAAVAPEPPAWR